MTEADVLDCFSASYLEARQKFLTHCASRSLAVESHRIPDVTGAQGEDLCTDVIRIGPANADRTLLLLSGTHGVEGYCGSGCQIGLLKSGLFDALPDGLNVVMVHAMNPYGFSHDRRVTEDNVDLNRNFIDFASPQRPFSDYGRLHDFLLPEDWDDPGREGADAGLRRYQSECGMAAFQAAVSSGQYEYPDGLFYGGAQPSWSNTMFRSVLARHVSSARKLAVIDFHTGLGPHGYGELIAIGTRAGKARAADWYGGEVTDPEAGTSTSAALDGMVAGGIAQMLGDAELTFVTLEFGTVPVMEVLTALRGDNWLHHNEDAPGPLRAEIKRNIRAAFYPDTDDWKIAVWKRAAEVTARALAGIAGQARA